MDDMLIAGSCLQEKEKLIQQLAGEFAMKDFSAAKQILRMRISRDRAQGNLKLSQVVYIKRVLQIFNMKNAKPVGSPLANHFKHSKESSPKIEAEKSL